MLLIRLCLAASALLLTACASAPPPAPDLRVSGNRLFIAAEINGQPIEALLDSGAEMTLLDAAAAARLGLGTAGSADVRGSGAATEEVTFAEGLQTRAAGITLENQMAAVLDLTDISARVVGEPVAAILGREIFDAARFYLDIETGAFRTANDTTLDGAVRLPLTDAMGIKQVPVRIEGQPESLADFDLGNGSRVLISEAFARRAGLLEPARITGTESGGGIGGAVTRQLVTLETLEIAGQTLRNVEAAIDPSPDAPDANVGVSVLRRFDMLIDFPGGAVWLRPRAG
ncbi:MAG: aspartyl protease family protein [Hyphomonas sp.]|nr:aspartyl protease family protein [Hyphomonas sp.]